MQIHGLFIFILAITSVSATITNTTVVVPAGITGTTYTGIYDSTAGITTFASIRYGKNPIGQLRETLLNW